MYGSGSIARQTILTSLTLYVCSRSPEAAECLAQKEGL